MRTRLITTASPLTLVALTLLSTLVLLSSLAGCDDKKPAAGSHAADDHHGHDHKPGDGHDHAHNDLAKEDKPGAGKSDGHGHASSVIALGEHALSAFTVVATRDEGAVVPGKDTAIDATVTPAAGSTLKAAAVRFWIGTKDAKGSVKARAEIEDPKNAPNRWHTHTEIPSPMPAESKLWVEIEDDKGGPHVVSFDLKN